MSILVLCNLSKSIYTQNSIFGSLHQYCHASVVTERYGCLFGDESLWFAWRYKHFAKKKKKLCYKMSAMLVLCFISRSSKFVWNLCMFESFLFMEGWQMFIACHVQGHTLLALILLSVLKFLVWMFGRQYAMLLAWNWCVSLYGRVCNFFQGYPAKCVYPWTSAASIY